jgi:hypothetical protein
VISFLFVRWLFRQRRFRGSDQLGTAAAPINPLLGALAFNGGPTETHKQMASSRAIDRGDNSFAPPIDQRGLVRPRHGNKDGSFTVDIGSFEF